VYSCHRRNPNFLYSFIAALFVGNTCKNGVSFRARIRSAIIVVNAPPVSTPSIFRMRTYCTNFTKPWQVHSFTRHCCHLIILALTCPLKADPGRMRGSVFGGQVNSIILMVSAQPSERGEIRTLNQWLKRPEPRKRFSPPMVYYTSLSPLDKL
jgi:hypothetical protein